MHRSTQPHPSRAGTTQARPGPAIPKRAMTRHSGTALAGVWLVGLLAMASCKSEEQDLDWRAPPAVDAQKPIARSPDRLPPGELMEGTEAAFGLSVPKGMQLTAPTQTLRRFAGRVDFDELTRYVRDRISARHAELRKDSLFFETARVRGGDPNRSYAITLRKTAAEQVVLIEDITRAPSLDPEGSDLGWNRAGLKPNGELIDPSAME